MHLCAQEGGQLKLSAADLQPHLAPLLEKLFAGVGKGSVDMDFTHGSGTDRAN